MSDPCAISLFSGIGGFDKGAEDAGVAVELQVENDKFCNRVLAKQWPHTPREGDIAEVSGRKHRGSTDVVLFGSPCQGLSVAGRRAGLADARSNLFFEAARFIDECRPSLAVWENVFGAFSSPTSHPGRDFAVVLRTLAELGARDIAWRVVNSRYAGVPQQRRRVYLVADFAAERAGAVLYQPEACEGHPRSSGAAGEEVARPLGSNATGGRRGDLEGDTYIPEVSYPLQAHAGKMQTLDADRMTYVPEVARCISDASDKRHGAGNSSQSTIVAIQDLRSGADKKRQNGSGVRDDGTMYTLDSVSQHAVAIQERAYADEGSGPDGKGWRDDGVSFTVEGRGRTQAVAYDLTQITSPGNVSHPQPGDPCHPLAAGAYALMVAIDEVAYTLSPSMSRSQGNTAGQNGALLNNVMHGARVRFLTPIEQERLQGFPDGWTCLCGAEADLWACACPDGPRNKALGNAITTTVARWLCERVKAAL